jgi:hypothetical protein
MKIDFVAEEAKSLAVATMKHLKQRKLTAKFNEPLWKDASYITQISGVGGDCPKLFELQAGAQYIELFKNFVRYVASQRISCEIYLVTSSDAAITGADLKDLKADGVGLILVDGRLQVTIQHEARNPALTVNVDPTLKFSAKSVGKEVVAAIQKFNQVNRKDGLKDMCEIVERETLNLGLKAVQKNHLNITGQDFESKNFHGQIQTLGTNTSYHPGKPQIFDANASNDMQSFRGARNLLNHKAKNKAEELRRNRQMHDRMVMGARLVSELLDYQRKVH